MRMPTQKHVEFSVGSLLVYLGRMGKQDGKFIRRYIGCCSFKVVRPVKVRIIDPGKMNALGTVTDRNGLVQQHSDSHFLESRQHPNAVMISEHTVHRLFDKPAEARHCVEGSLIRPEALPPVITGENADVVGKARQQGVQSVHGLYAQVYMQIAELKDRESVEAAWDFPRSEVIGSDRYLSRISASPAIQACDYKTCLDHEMRPRKVLKVEIVDSLPEDLRLMVRLKTETQSGMQSSEALLQARNDVVLVQARATPRLEW